MQEFCENKILCQNVKSNHSNANKSFIDNDFILGDFRSLVLLSDELVLFANTNVHKNSTNSN